LGFWREHQATAAIDCTNFRIIYEAAGIDLALLHTALSDTHQRDIVEQLRSGQLRAVGLVGMLSEGFDLPALRLAAYHDKHRSLPATVHLSGRLAPR